MIPAHVLSCGLAMLAATPVPPAGIVGARSPERMQPAIAEGHVSLNGKWHFRLDEENVGEQQQWFERVPEGQWGTIWVPGSWQAQGYGLDYHGVGWYRRTFEIPRAWDGHRVWLRFAGAATSAKVWVNGQFVREHVGNWAPFVVCISNAVRTDVPNVLVVRVEEMPDHFSAGFARVPGLLGQKDGHFGGLWQEVSLYSTRAGSP
jgi:hypothetical protein